MAFLAFSNVRVFCCYWNSADSAADDATTAEAAAATVTTAKAVAATEAAATAAEAVFTKWDGCPLILQAIETQKLDE